MVLGVAMCLASVVYYGLAQMIAASTTDDAPVVSVHVDTATSPTVGVTASASPLLFPAAGADALQMISGISDTTMLLAAGAVLIGAAAGVRRHTC